MAENPDNTLLFLTFPNDSASAATRFEIWWVRARGAIRSREVRRYGHQRYLLIASPLPSQSENTRRVAVDHLLDLLFVQPW